MQTSFYASGFLYNLKTHQLLLLQSKQDTDLPSLWSTLGGEGIEGEDALVTFQRTINQLLKVNLKSKDIYTVYDYFHDQMAKVNYVFYAEVNSSKEFDPIKGDTFTWMGFDVVSKLLFTEHTKQDVIVGERVINAKWREDFAKRDSQL